MADGGRPYSVYVTGLSQFKKKAVENKLITYFQSKRKSGGGECNVKILEHGEALVTFNKEDAKKSVLDRKHTITIDGESIPLTVSQDCGKTVSQDCGKTVSQDCGKTVSQDCGKTNIAEDAQKLISPVKDASSSKAEVPLSSVENTTLEGADPVESSRVCIKVDAENFSWDNFIFFIECCSGTSAFNVRQTNEATTFILEFTDGTGVHEAGWDNNNKITFVESLSHQDDIPSHLTYKIISQDIWFEEVVELEWGRTGCDLKMRMRLLNSDPLGDEELMELGESNDLKEAIHCFNRKSFQEMKLTATQLPRTAQLRVTQLSKPITQDHLELYFERELESPHPVKAVLDGTKQSAIIFFPDPETAERILAKPHHIHKSLLKIHRYYESHQLTEFATESDAKDVGPSIQEKDSESLVERNEDQTEVKSGLVTEECFFKNKYYVQILCQQNLKQEFSTVQLHFDTSSNVVQITGKETEVLRVQLKLFSKGNQVATKIIQVSKYLKMFLSALNKEDFFTELFVDSKINVTFSCDEAEDRVVIYGASELHVQKGEEKVERTFAEDKIPIPEDFHLNKQKDFSLFIKETARSLKISHPELKNIEENFLFSHFLESKGSSGVPNCLILVGYKTVIDEAKQYIEDYILKNSPCEFPIDVDSPGVFEYVQRFVNFSDVLQGAKIEFLKNKDQLSLKVQATMKNASHIKAKVTDILMEVKVDTRTLRQPGAIQFFDKNRDLLKKLENPYRCIIRIVGQGEKQTDVDVSEKLQTVSTIDFMNTFKISVMRDNIIYNKADTILHPTHKFLECNSGLSKELVEAAGIKLKEVLNIRKSRVQAGDVFTTEAGNLPYELIVHIVGAKALHLKEDQEVLKAAIVKALMLVDSNFSRSIAIPNFSSRQSESSIVVILKAIKEYCQKVDKPILTDIRLVCGDDSSAKAMNKALKKMMVPESKTSKFASFRKLAFKGNKKQEPNKEPSQSTQQPNPAVSTIQTDSKGSPGRIFTTPEGVQVALLKGNIAEQKVDVIVNTVSSNMKLEFGAASKAILRKAGNQLQVNTINAAGCGIFDCGDVLPVSTQGCKLNCQAVYNTVCCQWSTGQAENVLIAIIQRCLEKAHKSHYKSLSFPAIGTGNLSFPKDLVAKTFLDAIIQFSKANSSSSLKEVNLVIYEKDLECYEAFEDAILTALGLPPNEILCIKEERKRNVRPPPGTTKEKVRIPLSPSCIILMDNVTLEIWCEESKLTNTEAVLMYKDEAKGKGIGNFKVTQEGSRFCVYGQIKTNIDLTNVLMTALCNGEDIKFRSLCIPVLRSTSTEIVPGEVKAFAGAVIEAVYQFEMRKPESLTKVTVSNCSPEYVLAFEELKKMKAEKSSFTHALTKMFSWVSGAQMPDDNPKVPEYIFEPVQFEFYSTKGGKIQQAWDDIQKLVNKEQLVKYIPLTVAYEKITEDDLEEIITSCTNMEVSVNIDKQKASICLSGCIADVCSVQDTIFNVCHKIGAREMTLREEIFLMEKVCWKLWLEDHWEKFNPNVNAQVENAFNRQENEVRVEIEDDCCWVLDLKKSTCTDDDGNVVRIRRTCTGDDILPDNWIDVEDQTKFSEVPLKSDSSEYKEVATAFVQSLANLGSLPGFKIDSIKRIQNPTLWRLYVAQRNEMNRGAAQSQNEKILYHGTTSDTCAKINAGGFNRSYCGANNVCFGEGTYFAINASYSASDTYSKPDANGFKLIYRARVLTGEYGQGQRNMKEPPLKSQQGGPDRYDSVTDQMQYPSMFVVFQDNQAYPEYLITYGTK